MTTFCVVLVKWHFVACNPSWTASPMVIICIEKGLLAEGLWCCLFALIWVKAGRSSESRFFRGATEEWFTPGARIAVNLHVSHFCSCDKMHTNRLEQGPAIIAHCAWRWENGGSRGSGPAAHTAFGVQKQRRDGRWCLAHSVLCISVQNSTEWWHPQSGWAFPAS